MENSERELRLLDALERIAKAMEEQVAEAKKHTEILDTIDSRLISVEEAVLSVRQRL